MVSRTLLASLALVATLAAPAFADFSTGSTGADGAFNPASNTVVDLSLAGTGPGTGTYDPLHWAVVFHYTTIDVAAGRTVTFLNHPSGAPVVWLAQGQVNLAGTVNLNGATGATYSLPASFAAPGPGGFEGGRREIDPIVSRACAGFGPGGAPFATYGGTPGGGGYATAGRPGTTGAGGGTYGDEYIRPLIGGSGGASSNFGASYGAGAGGGAILIASPTGIVLSGTVSANGGGGGGSTGGAGSGGAIRLRAPSVTGFGKLRAHSFSSTGSVDTTYGLGRIRIEAEYVSLADIGIPEAVASATASPIFPDPGAPTLIATMIDTTSIPSEPVAGIASIDAVVADVGLVTLHIAATNIEPGTTVDVIVVPDGGLRVVHTSTPLAGTLASSTATATFQMDRLRRTEFLLRADTAVAPVTRAAAGASRP